MKEGWGNEIEGRGHRDCRVTETDRKKDERKKETHRGKEGRKKEKKASSEGKRLRSDRDKKKKRGKKKKKEIRPKESLHAFMQTKKQ